MSKYTQDDMARAIEDVVNSKPVKAAMRDQGVPYTTLRERIRGSETHSIIAESQQRLLKAQEDHLANWILTQEALGVPLTHG